MRIPAECMHHTLSSGAKIPNNPLPTRELRGYKSTREETSVPTARILFLALVALASFEFPSEAPGAPGDLDATFGTGGSVTTAVSSGLFGYAVVAVQPDGKILVATDGETTNADLAVARYNSSGALDPTWGTGGVTFVSTSPFDESAVAMEVQPDGKVLVAVQSDDLKVVRLDSSGSIDFTWGTAGVVWTNLDGGGFDAYGDMLLLPDGRVLVGGSYFGDFGISRFSSSGVLDPTFGGYGVISTDFGSTAVLSRLAVDESGRILATGAAGGEIVTSRYYGTGVPDPTFGTNGIVTITAGTTFGDQGRDVLVQPDGKILVLGQDGSTTALEATLWLVVRYDENGALDPTWGGTGIVETSVPGPPASSNTHKLLLQGDGKPIAVGASLPDHTVEFDIDFATVRYQTDGTLDTSWGGTGIVLDDFGSTGDLGTDAVLQEGAKLVVAGTQSTTASILVARYEVGDFCGDGIIQGGEQCDDENVLAGDCCSPTCTFEPAASACNEEGNPCTTDACDGAGTCLHTPMPEGSSCDDGNTCTAGETCTAGVCDGGTPGGPGCLNPFVCYKTKKSRDGAKFGGASAVSLSDGLESGAFDVKSQFELCVPATVNEVGVLDPNIRQIGYKLKTSSGQPKHVKQNGIVVRDYFGVRSYDTKKAELLFSPAHLELGAPATPPTVGAADYYKCYKVKLSQGQPQFPRTVVTADEEFENRYYDVYLPRRLCYPVDRDGQGIVDSNQLLTCYRLRRSLLQPQHDKIVNLIQTADGFGDLKIDTNKERDLCMPAELLP